MSCNKIISCYKDMSGHFEVMINLYQFDWLTWEVLIDSMQQLISGLRNQSLSCQWVSRAFRSPPPRLSLWVPAEAHSSASVSGRIRSSRCSTAALPEEHDTHRETVTSGKNAILFLQWTWPYKDHVPQNTKLPLWLQSAFQLTFFSPQIANLSAWNGWNVMADAYCHD